MRKAFDVAVVGAGLAGLQCARLLAIRGMRVALLDRKRSVGDAIHTTGIFVRKTWEDFALPDEQLGQPIRRVTLYSPMRRAMKLEADHDEFRVGRMAWLYVYLLEQCARAGVVWMPSSRVTAIAGTTIVTDRQSIEARFIIGADGPRSAVARALALDANTQMLLGVEDVLPSANRGEPELHCYLDPRLAPGYIAWLVDDGVEAHIGVAGYRDRFDPNAALARFRAEIAGRIAGATPLERRGGFIPVGGTLRRVACTRGLLVGDAAGAVSPLTAGGLDAALRLSRFAAEVTEAYLTTGDATVLAHYSGDAFRARFLTRTWMRHAMRLVESPAAMELASALLRTPPLRTLASHIFFARGSFPEPAPLPRFALSRT
ncbi:MAG TPA: NAD(P)/FAD-dependent oxidoreductase [Thermoanaerobaculia bacterium]|jgi:flavin-dependent dehydrogenase